MTVDIIVIYLMLKKNKSAIKKEVFIKLNVYE